MSKPTCLEVGGSSVSTGGVKIVRDNVFFFDGVFRIPCVPGHVLLKICVTLMAEL